MALTDRKKKGIAYIATAVVLAAGGVVLLVTTATPTWVPVAIDAAVAVLGIIGIVVVAKPEV